MEERRLVYEDDLIGRDEDAIEFPVKEGFKDGGESEEDPQESEYSDDPPRWDVPWEDIPCVYGHACGDESHREDNLEDDLEKEEEAMTVGGQNLLFIRREEPSLYSFDIGVESEDAH